MPMLQKNPTSKKAVWEPLEDHKNAMRDAHLRDLFADDPGRGRRMTAEAAKSRQR
jgi:glucose-6-phosphate isomerase